MAVAELCSCWFADIYSGTLDPSSCAWRKFDGASGGRFQENRYDADEKNGSDELSKLLSEWQEFEVNLNNSPYREKVTREHWESLQNCIRYLERRIQYRSQPLFLRFIFCLLLLKDYFLFGNGFRSAARNIADL